MLHSLPLPPKATAPHDWECMCAQPQSSGGDDGVGYSQLLLLLLFQAAVEQAQHCESCSWK